MNKEALQKILFPCFLLLIAWIITIFTFYHYQPAKTSTEELAIKKFSNLSPSPTTEPTPKIEIYQNSRSTISVTPTVTVPHAIYINSPISSSTNSPNGNSNPGSRVNNNAPAIEVSPGVSSAEITPAITVAPTAVNTNITTSVPTPTSIYAGNNTGTNINNCVNNGVMILCQTFSPSGSSTGGTTGVGSSTNLVGTTITNQSKPN